MSLLLAAYAATSLLIHAISTATASSPLRRTPLPRGPLPPVTVLRPVSGLHAEIEQTLTSSFGLTGTKFEVLFCAETESDPAVALVRKLLAAHPEVDAKVLIGVTEESFNPKLDNLEKGWRAAKYRHILMVDSNVILEPDCLVEAISLLAQHDVGLVSSPPLAVRPEGFAAELETAFLNGHQLRWQLMADAFGSGFAQGKFLFLQKETLGPEGLSALTREYAEDAAATKLLREQKLRVHLLRPSVTQPVGKRTFSQVWSRQERWAQLRWNSFPAAYLPEILSGGAFPTLAAFAAFGKEGLAFMLVWYGLEAALLRANRWHRTAPQMLAMVLRDLLLPALWLSGLCKRYYDWNGHRILLKRRGPQKPARRARIAKS